jgi:hypothetical protein
MTALPGLDPSFRKAQNLIGVASRRLRARYVVRWATRGAWVGFSLCVILAVASRFYWHLSFGPGWFFPLIALLGIAAGSVIGMLVPTLTGRDLLAFTDKSFGIDELLLTAAQMPEGPAKAALSRALGERLDAVPAAAKAIPVRRPSIRALGLLGAVAIACLFLPHRVGAVVLQTAPGEVGHEGERLEERLGEVDKSALPPELAGELDDLVTDMKSGSLTDDEATARIEEVQKDLDSLEQSLEPGAAGMKDLEDAAKALSQAKSAEALADAIDDGDLDKASRAAQELAGKMDEMSPEERKQLGEALKDAGKRLAESKPELQPAAQAMTQAGNNLAGTGGQGSGQGNSSGQPQPLGPGGAGSQGAGQNGNGQTANGQGVNGQNGASGQSGGQNGTPGQNGTNGQNGTSQSGANGQNGTNGQNGQPGSQGAGSSGSNGQGAAQSMNQLSQELARNQALAQQMKNDQQLLQQSQKVNGAMQASQNRLQNGQNGNGQPGNGQPGQGQPGTPGQGQNSNGATSSNGGDGQGQGAGQGQGDGQGQGQGNGQGGTGSGQGNGGKAGSGHTWLDQGSTPGYEASGHQDENRQSTRTSNKSVDDFKQLYAPVFDPTHQGLLAGVNGTIDENGKIDEMPTRLTTGNETARTGLSGLPGDYKQAADQALNTERVPPGYRDAVRNYFGDSKPAPEK